ERIMRTLVKAVIALSFISAAAIGTTATVQAQGFYFDAPGVHVGVGGPYITTIMVAPITAADRVGRCRAVFVSPIAMVRGTFMEGGRAITDGNIWRPLRRPLF